MRRDAVALGLANERFDQPFGRPRDDVAADELADLLGGLRRRLRRPRGRCRRRRCTIVVTNAPPMPIALDDLHVGGFGHRVGRFDEADQALGFNQSDC